MLKNLSYRWCVLTAVLSLAAVAMAAGIALADTLDYHFSAGPGGGPGVPQFDPSLGTLQSVTLSADVMVIPGGMSTFGVENLNASQGGNVSVTFDYNGNVWGPDGLSVAGNSTSTTTGSVSPFDGAMDGQGSDTFTCFAGPGGGTGANTISSGFADYVGLGSVTFSATGVYQANFSGDPGLTLVPVGDGIGGGGGEGQAVGDLIYTYAPVPEPSTLVLLGIGANGLLGYGWRRRAKTWKVFGNP